MGKTKQTTQQTNQRYEFSRLSQRSIHSNITIKICWAQFVDIFTIWIFYFSSKQEVRWRPGKSMGLYILVRIHLNCHSCISVIDRSHSVDCILGILLPWWCCMAWKANATVQFASNFDGCWIYYAVWFL